VSAHNFVLTFVPLFIVIDAIGNLPFVIAASEGMTGRERFRMINIAITTAAIVGLAFLFLGQLILNAMGISFGSFAIAGGLILLALSIRYMITGHMVESAAEETRELVGVVPIGTPLTVGPATITTLLLLVKQQQGTPPQQEFPLYMILISFALNLFIAWIICLAGTRIVAFLGRGGIKAVSRVFSLLLAAIAVSMVIKGMEILGVLHLAT
jgi:multiple antibiotic resistance protein